MGAQANAQDSSKAPLIVRISSDGHNDHCSNAWKEHAADAVGYHQCVCHGEYYVGFEGLWSFSLDEESAAMKRGRRRGGTPMVEQRVTMIATKTRRKSGSVETEWFSRWEFLPVGADGKTEPDPHWWSFPFDQYCGARVEERIIARAVLVDLKKGAEDEKVIVTYANRGRGRPPAGRDPNQPGTQYHDDEEDLIQDVLPFEVPTPWSGAQALYTPYHCLGGYYTPGTNVGPRVPGSGGGTPTPPDGGGGTPTPGGEGTSSGPGHGDPYDPPYPVDIRGQANP
jgi:hypothetical protein